MEKQPQQFKRSARANLLLGIILMFLGLFLIADLADVIPWRFRDFLFTWQALLIFLGVVFLSGKDKGTGLIMIAVGTFFLMPKFFELPHYWRSLFWPSLLILLGLVVIFGSRRQDGFFNQKKKASGDDLLDDVAVFGGGDRIIYSQNFQGGKITNIFGGSKYDLTGSKLATGRNYLDITMIFGGSKFVIPEGWDVKIEVTAIFGGFSDKRVRSMVVKDEDKTLVISGVTIFGGGEIVNYH
jgi:predicted membrane protein